MLPVLAHLAESQAHWLEGREQEVTLYRAAALYYEGPAESKQQAAELLASILEQGASVPTTIDATFLLASLKEQTDRIEAAELYKKATELKDHLDLANEDPDVQRHLRLTLAKSFFNLASALETKGDPLEPDEAESYYRHGIQILQGMPEIEPGYEAEPVRRLLAILKKRGKIEEILDRVQRGSEIEKPVRQRFLEEALTEPIDTAYLYYAMAALHHGSGYDQQLINVEVNQDGSAHIEGTYTLMALSMLSQTDTYLEVPPESSPEVGIRFETLESMTPEFALRFKREGFPRHEKLAVVIDPPMEPGERLSFRWTATASAGTFATTPEQLAGRDLDYEQVAWEIIAPIKRLEIQVLIPSDQSQLPRTWFELWRVGTWHTAGQAQAAYRAFLKDDPSRVQWNAEIQRPDQLELNLRVNYPCLALTYVLAWEVV
jgi:hypothetical protein